MKRNAIALLLLVGGFVGETCFGQEKSVGAKATSQAVLDAIQAHEVAGAVTIVANRDSIIDLQVLGMSDIDQQQAMKKDSIFWIASMSKPVTGACVMMMVDEGKLSLDDAIDNHLPEMTGLKGKDGKHSKVTIRQLMNHTSGMSEIPSPNTYASTTLEEATKEYSKLPTLFVAGSQWQYSQTGINTAARIVEVVSGMSFDRFVDERLCKPLGMADTTFYLNDEQSSRLVVAYKRSDTGELTPSPIFLLNGRKPTDRDRFPAANGGLFSTASDYARFCQMLLNEGTMNGKKILSVDSARAMSQISTASLVTAFTPGNGWGVGCCVVREPQGASAVLSPGSFGHGGAFGTQAWIDPIRARIYILMVQRSNFPNGDDSSIRKAFQAAASTLE